MSVRDRSFELCSYFQPPDRHLKDYWELRSTDGKIKKALMDYSFTKVDTKLTSSI